MIFTVLFDLFFAAVGIFASWRLVDALRTRQVRYQTGQFSRTAAPVTYWIVSIFYAALVVGSIYGVAVGFELQ